MNKKLVYIFIFLFGIILFPKNSNAQKIGETPTDDLGNVSDKFQEYFFEALKQKGIENYELAIDALRKAEKAANKNEENKAAVYFEMGKNLFQLKRFQEAETYFNKVLSWDPNRKEVLEALYDVHYEEKDYEAAILLVKKLIEYDSDYKEDLANLYNRTKQYDKALELLDELDEEWGESNYRNALRNQIYRVTGNTSEAINKLEEKIDKNPKSEQEYLNLIFLYSDEGNSKKAFETARELLKQKPNSKLVHLALYKYYLEEENLEEAIKSMKIVFETQEIEKDSKIKVFEDFLIYTKKNPSFKAEIKSVIPSALSDDDSHIYLLLGDFFLSEENKEEALTYYLQGVEADQDNYGLLKNTILLQIEVEQYQQASELSIQGIEIFPAQSLLYLTNGVANNHLKNADIAIETLEEGLDYLFDNPKMEYDFYQQLSIAYQLKGNNKKVKIYNKKASELTISNQKTDN